MLKLSKGIRVDIFPYPWMKDVLQTHNAPAFPNPRNSGCKMNHFLKRGAYLISCFGDMLSYWAAVELLTLVYPIFPDKVRTDGYESGLPAASM